MDKITKINFKNLFDNVVNWGYDKGIIKKDNSFPQFQKVIEEMGEVGSALFHDNKDNLIDGIGDLLVTVIINAEQNAVKINLDAININKLSIEDGFKKMTLEVVSISFNKTSFQYKETVNSIINFAYSIDLCPYECLNIAYDVISKRKTKTVNGKVLKV